MISWRFIFQKLIHLILVFIGVSIVTFCISHVIPGDPARMLVGPHASPETLEAARQSLGLDKPVLTQYALYMDGFLYPCRKYSYLPGDFHGGRVHSPFLVRRGMPHPLL